MHSSKLRDIFHHLNVLCNTFDSVSIAYVFGTKILLRSSCNVQLLPYAGAGNTLPTETG